MNHPKAGCSEYSPSKSLVPSAVTALPPGVLAAFEWLNKFNQWQLTLSQHLGFCIVIINILMTWCWIMWKDKYAKQICFYEFKTCCLEGYHNWNFSRHFNWSTFWNLMLTGQCLQFTVSRIVVLPNRNMSEWFLLFREIFPNILGVLT